MGALSATGGGRYGPKTGVRVVYTRTLNTLYPSVHLRGTGSGDPKGAVPIVTFQARIAWGKGEGGNPGKFSRVSPCRPFHGRVILFL